MCVSMISYIDAGAFRGSLGQPSRHATFTVQIEINDHTITVTVIITVITSIISTTLTLSAD